MEEQKQNTDQLPSEDNTENNVIEEEVIETGSNGVIGYLIPLIFCVFLFVGFSQEPLNKKSVKQDNNEDEITSQQRNIPKVNFSALLAAEEFSKNLRDTVFTDSNIWLELRIDKQMLYVHYRNGKIVTYPVSTGRPNASKSIEARPGLYAIFVKTEVHLSSQFNNARLNYFMPFNMGIGFHGLQGTGYYASLGKQPSSHGCIRMRNEDVKVLFKECDIGTLVLSHRGYSNRIVAFAPEGFRNEFEYTKDDYMNMLAYNLGSIMEGKYFINPPKKFVLDGKIIPTSGINVLANTKLPDKQILPFAVAKFDMISDRLDDTHFSSAGNLTEFDMQKENFGINKRDSVITSNVELAVAPELIKKYVYNPLGVLPYFPPDR